MDVILAILFVMAALVCALGMWRFFTLRTKGFPVVVRPASSKDGRHWRHGVLVYSGTAAKFYKLRSVRPVCNLYFTRLGTEILGRREITPREAGMLDKNTHVVRIAHRAQEWEIAVNSSGDTALVAWLESGPSARRASHSAFNRPRPI